MAGQIFISYSKKDKDFAWKLADDLVNAGHKVWIDRSLVVGEDWEQTIEKKLKNADEVIVILSSNSIASKWVQHEGSIAYGLKKQMYPILIEALPVEDLPLWMSKFQYHSFIDVDYEPAFKTLNAVLTPPNPIQDLLEQQVNGYQQTGSLMGAAMLQVIEEARGTLQVGTAAEELIQKSSQAIQLEQEKELDQERNLEKTRRQRTMVLTTGLIIALTLSVISYSLYQTSNRRGQDLSIALTGIVAKSNAVETAQVESEQQQHIAKIGQFVAQSFTEFDLHPQRSLLLLVEGFKRETPRLVLAEQALHQVDIAKYGIPFRVDKTLLTVPTISPDGNLLAGGGSDFVLYLWNLTDLTAGPRLLRGHSGEINTIIFSPEGRWLLSSSSNEVLIWDLSNLEAGPRTLQIKYPIALSPTGNWLAGGSEDGSLELIYLNNGNDTFHKIIDISGIVLTKIKFSVDESLLAFDGHTKDYRSYYVGIQNLTDSNQKPIYFPPNGWSEDFSISPDNHWLADSQYEKIRIWNLEAPIESPIILNGHRDVVTELTFSLDGKWLASSSMDTTVRLWDTQNFSSPPFVLTGHTGGVYYISFSPNSHWLVSDGGGNPPDNKVLLWNVTSRNPSENPILLSGIEGGANFAQFESTRGDFITAAGEDGMIRVWKVSDILNETKSIQIDGGNYDPALVVISHVNNWLAYGDDVADLETFSIFNSLMIHDSPSTNSSILLDRRWNSEGKDNLLHNITSIDFSPDDHWFAMGTYEGNIQLFNMQNFPSDPTILSSTKGKVVLAFHPTGNVLASADASSYITIWNIRNPSKPVSSFEGCNGITNDLVFSPDGQWITAACSDGKILSWDINGKMQFILNGNSEMNGLVYAPTGKILAGGDKDGTVFLWDLSNSSHPILKKSWSWGNKILDVKFSPSGRWLGITDGTVHILDMSGSDSEAYPLFYNDSIGSLAFGDHGNTLVAGGRRSIYFWPMPEKLLDQACRLAGRNLTSEEWNQYFPGEDYRKTCDQWPPEPLLTPPSAP